MTKWIGAGAFKIYKVTDDSAADVGQPVGTEYYTTRVYAQDGVAHVRNEAFYLQDQWSIMNDRLRFDIGGIQNESRITSLRKVDWGSLHANFFVMYTVGDHSV